jgi:DUF4097 and DUF4098 domain-containing protein YvlB
VIAVTPNSVTSAHVDIHFNAGRLQIVGGEGDLVELDGTGSGRLRRDGANASIHFDDEAEATVVVPADARVDVHADSADVSAMGIQRLEIHISAGDIDGIDISGPVDIHADSADIALDNVDGRIDIHVSSGEVEILRAAGAIDIHSDSGDIVVQGESERVDVHCSSSEVVLDLAPDGRGRYEVHADSGDVSVRLPAGTEVDADLVADSGEVVNDAPHGEDVRLKVRTSSGDITVLCGVPAIG